MSKASNPGPGGSCLLLLVALALSAFGVPAARASVMLALDLAELVDLSDQIVVARAHGQQSRWHAGGRLIVTDVRLVVETALKGPATPGQSLVATRLGGRLEKLALRVPGSASFVLGQRVLVFLYRVPSGDLRVVGMSQGVLAVELQQGVLSVLPGAAEQALLGWQVDGSLAAAPDAMLHPRPLVDVLAEIRRLVGDESGG